MHWICSKFGVNQIFDLKNTLFYALTSSVYVYIEAVIVQWRQIYLLKSRNHSLFRSILSLPNSNTQPHSAPSSWSRNCIWQLYVLPIMGNCLPIYHDSRNSVDRSNAVSQNLDLLFISTDRDEIDRHKRGF